jgi:hypothetical protein
VQRIRIRQIALSIDFGTVNAPSLSGYRQRGKPGKSSKMAVAPAQGRADQA